MKIRPDTLLLLVLALLSWTVLPGASFVVQQNPGSPAAALTAASRLEATTTISRKDFGITALPVAVADNIDITVTMNARPEYIRLAGTRNQDNI